MRVGPLALKWSYMLVMGSDIDCGRENVLSIWIRLRTTGTGSLFGIPKWKSCTCTTSYLPTRGLDGSARQSWAWKETFGGSHSFGGHCVRSMSNPSSCADGGKVVARSTSQILLTLLAYRLHEATTHNYPVPTPISATFSPSTSVWMLGWSK